MTAPAQAARPRPWRRVGARTRAALALLALALAGVAWDSLSDRPDPWSARAVLKLPPRNWPLGFGPDGRTFLTSGELGIVAWDLASGRKGMPWLGRSSAWFVNRGTWSPDGKTFAAIVNDHPRPASLELIDAATGRATATLASTHPIVCHLAFVGEGRSLRAFLGDSRTVKEAATWDLASGRLTSSRPIASVPLGSIFAFSPDGRSLAAFMPRATAVQLIDLEADRPLATLADPSRPGPFGHDLEFSPDGRTLAVAREGGFVDLWEVAARKVSRTLAVHPRGFLSNGIRFAPDGRTLASSATEESGPARAILDAYSDLRRRLTGRGLDQRSELVVVDVDTGEQLARGSSHHFAMYSPDGRSIATIGDDQEVRIRDLPAPASSKGSRP